jgi:exo-beta-1,3-glucanase (GH17 family)
MAKPTQSPMWASQNELFAVCACMPRVRTANSIAKPRSGRSYSDAEEALTALAAPKTRPGAGLRGLPLLISSLCLSVACTLADTNGLTGGVHDAGSKHPPKKDAGQPGAGDGDGDMPGAGDGDADSGMEMDGGSVPDPENDAGNPAPDSGMPFARRVVPAAVLARKGICYSGYRDGQGPGNGLPTESQMKADLQLVVRAGYGMIRMFDTGMHASQALKVIKDNNLDLKVQLGLWIAQGNDNAGEISRGVALAGQYPTLVSMISVGDESMSSWGTAAEDLAGHLAAVRSQVTQPVGFDEKGSALLPDTTANISKVYQTADFVSVHFMVLTDAIGNKWDWKQMDVAENMRARAMMDAALAYVQTQFSAVEAAVHKDASDMVLTLGETGWKDVSAQPADESMGHLEGYLAHPVNQLWMHDDFEAWVYGDKKDAHSPAAMMMFEAFNEMWKLDDDHWGLFNADRTAKYVVWSHVPSLKPVGALTPADSEAVYYKP